MDTGREGRDTVTKNLALAPKMDKIKLNDGNEYELTPINLNIMAELEEKFDKPLDQLYEKSGMRFVRFLLYLRLKNKYPEFDSEEKVGALVTPDILVQIGSIYGVA